MNERGIKITPDFTMLIYPIHVLSTNRIINTIIYRKNPKSKFRALDDLRTMYRIQGVRAFFLGLVPYSITAFINHTEYFSSQDGEVGDDVGNFWFFFGLLMWNPLNILCVRMQCVDFPHKKLRHAVKDMIKKDRLSLLYKGMVPIFLG